jgi:phenylacetate-CoA ligase
MNDLITQMYSFSPVFMQNLYISAYGWRLANKRYGETYRKKLDLFARRDISDVAVQKEIQNRKFLDFLSYALEYSPFYKEFYRDVDLSRVKTVDDISLLPVLDKETLRKNAERIYSTESKPFGYAHTGGTTGKSLIVKVLNEDSQIRMAYLDWFKSLYGFTMCVDRHARFNGKSIIPARQKSKIFWRDNRSINQRIYSSFYASYDNLRYYIENLNEYRPKELDGFCSTIYDIARYMIDNGIDPTFEPYAVFTTSETVMPHHRKVIEKAFGAKVRDQYASSEGAPFIIEMPDGYMHECLDTGVFEHIRTPQGTKLVVTSFTTHGCPLIRYDIGDNIIECDETDHPDTGIGFPAIKAIEGRKQDFLYSEERGFVSAANLSNVIKSLPNSVINVQFVQHSIDEIHINLVVDKDRYDKCRDETVLLDEMRKRFGKTVLIGFNYLDRIERTKGGKYQTVINEVIKHGLHE